MTRDEIIQYRYKWDRFSKRYERIYTTKFKTALKDQVQQQRTKGTISSEPIYKVLVDLYKTVGTLWSHATQVNVQRQSRQKAMRPMGFNERIVELMRNYYSIDLLNDAETITNYTREIIARILADAALSGAGINDIVKQMESSTELGAMRARRIARTETVTAANGASLINAKELGVPMRKIWLAVHDKRTRHAHLEIDEHKASLNQPFDLGGVLMMQPGVRDQPNGLPVPAALVVNCRCTLGYEVIK